MEPFYLLITASALLLVIFMSGAGFVMIFRESRLRASRPVHDQTDLTNMMILFQTMRDVVSEQKDLARTFNASVERHFAEVRALVEEARRERDSLLEVDAGIPAVLTSLQNRLSVIEERVLGESVANSLPSISFTDAAAGAAPELDAEPPVENSEGVRSAPLDAQSQSGEASRGEPTTPPASFDFAGEEPSAHAFDVPDQVPEDPQDAQAARDAFRSLLDIEGTAAPALDDSPPAVNAGSESDNGKADGAIIRGRVYDYSDAGMSVSEIARELGVGKGEVRLILSLRKDQEV